jgi:hypothetical protein
MMNVRTTAYFDDLLGRAICADVIPREPWSGALANQCHTNCDSYVLQNPAYEVIRGWLVNDGHYFMPHSIVREVSSGLLTDITPDPSSSRLPFVEHRGSEADFSILRQGRDGGWLYPPLTVTPSSFVIDSGN